MRITRSVEIKRTPRLQQLDGLFDLAPALTCLQVWDVDLPLPETWSIGVIVGPSGSGKSTVARELFGAAMVDGFEWSADKSLVDDFPAKMPIKDITGLLSAVGFSSPPAWRKPFRVLSNGQQFRAALARTLAEKPGLACVDEFTSVVDRQVAQIGSAAVAKAVRARPGQKFVAVTCHGDVLDWLEPDWVYEPATNAFRLNVAPGEIRADGSRGLLWRRPALNLQIVRTTAEAWLRFKPHHYLSGELHRASKCFVGLIDGTPAVFTAVLSFPHPVKPGWREHRTVCMPDFQGIGIGNRMSEFVASMFAATGKPYLSTTSHPSMVRHRSTSPLWRVRRGPSLAGRSGSRNPKVGMRATTSTDRLTAGFEYVGPTRPDDARQFGITVSAAA